MGRTQNRKMEEKGINGNKCSVQNKKTQAACIVSETVSETSPQLHWCLITFSPQKGNKGKMLIFWSKWLSTVFVLENRLKEL